MLNYNNSSYEILKNREIIDILIGDKSFENLTDSLISISMPYLSGPQICEISSRFGKIQPYGGKNNLSRWIYFKNLLDFCITNNKTQNLLSFIFSIKQFTEKLKTSDFCDIERNYDIIIKNIIDNINKVLYFSGHILINNYGQFIVKLKDSKIEISAPKISKIDRKYIKDLTKRAIQDIEESNYDSAITKSRTILEEVFCYVIEKKNVAPDDSGKINKLFTQVKDLYNMHANKETDKRINELLSGLEKVISSIGSMRNTGSDSHGVGLKRINLDDYHTLLAVNSATSLADFILSVSEAAEK